MGGGVEFRQQQGVARRTCVECTRFVCMPNAEVGVCVAAVPLWVRKNNLISTYGEVWAHSDADRCDCFEVRT